MWGWPPTEIGRPPIRQASARRKSRRTGADRRRPGAGTFGRKIVIGNLPCAVPAGAWRRLPVDPVHQMASMTPQRGVWGQYLPLYIPELRFRYGTRLTRTFSEWRLRDVDKTTLSLPRCCVRSFIG